MGNIEIRNLKIEKPKNEWDIKVDRSSVLGNPFYMANESQRNNVCDLYKDYFDRKITNDAVFRTELMKIYKSYIQYEKLNLFCWCAPKRCHAETIKQALEKIILFGNINL